jgi:hypothetical protein
MRLSRSLALTLQGATLVFSLHLASACKTFPWDPETSYGADGAVEEEPGPELDAGWDEDGADADLGGPDAGSDVSEWGTPELIEQQHTGNAQFARIAVDGAGNAIAVWEQRNGTTPSSRYDLWANRYEVGVGWGTEELIENEDLGNASRPELVMDDAGNATAVWQQYDGTRVNIWSNRYLVATGWGTPELMEANTSDAYSPQIGIDGSGNVIVVWSSDGNIYANRYLVATGWETPERIDNSGTATNPHVAVDGAGNAAAVWEQTGIIVDFIIYNDIASNHYVAGVGWQTAELLESSGDHADTSRVAMDASGNAIATYQRYDGSSYDIWATRYQPAGGWGSAQLIETGDGDAWDAEVALDGAGNALAVWRQHDGIRNVMMANRYTLGAGWGDATSIEFNNEGNVYGAKIAMHQNGKAVVVWRRHDGSRYNLWANHYLPNMGWAIAEPIENSDFPAGNVSIAIEATGRIHGVWSQSDGIQSSIWSIRRE